MDGFYLANTIVSVSTLTQTLKKALESALLPLWVRGEVSNLRIQSSGHAYFTLKDKHSQISVVLFKGSFPSNLKLQDGIECIIYGEVSVYEPRGVYQIVARLVVPEKEGLLQLEFQKLKQKLEEGGYFKQEHKKAIPKSVSTLGVITSPTGAALQDFISVLKAKAWKGKLFIFPAKVQGQDAPSSLIFALQKAAATPGLEALVLTRGGGSVEDLWCFNDEALVKAIYACPIPVVCAVGHEIDFTLADFVADLRLPTPTAAAEFFADHYQSQEAQFLHIKNRFALCKRQGLKSWSLRLDSIKDRFYRYSFKKHLEYCYLHLDEAMRRLERVKDERFKASQGALERFWLKIQHYQPSILIKSYQERLLSLSDRLDATNPEHILRRGYALVRHENAKLIASVEGLRLQDHLCISLKDGELEVQVGAIRLKKGSI